MKRIVGKRFPVRLVRRERQEIDQAIGDVVGPGGLGSFLTLLPEHRRHSFEFRHPVGMRQIFFACWPIET
jgi:hypothetical protein